MSKQSVARDQGTGSDRGFSRCFRREGSWIVGVGTADVDFTESVGMGRSNKVLIDHYMREKTYNHAPICWAAFYLSLQQLSFIARMRVFHCLLTLQNIGGHQGVVCVITFILAFWQQG